VWDENGSSRVYNADSIAVDAHGSLLLMEGKTNIPDEVIAAFAAGFWSKVRKED
jgi:hypothetical protein